MLFEKVVIGILIVLKINFIFSNVTAYNTVTYGF
jgi:hypothetical protein